MVVARRTSAPLPPAQPMYSEDSWRKQWATLYVAFASPSLLPLSTIVEKLAPALRAKWETSQLPSYWTGAINIRVSREAVPQEDADEGEGQEVLTLTERYVSGGPFDGVLLQTSTGEGESGSLPRYLSVIKWNLRWNGHREIPDDILRTTRESVSRALSSNDYTVVNSNLRRYGERNQLDKGYPSTPSLPPVPLKDERLTLQPDQYRASMWPLLLLAGAGLYAASKAK